MEWAGRRTQAGVDVGKGGSRMWVPEWRVELPQWALPQWGWSRGARVASRVAAVGLTAVGPVTRCLRSLRDSIVFLSLLMGGSTNICRRYE